MFQEVLLMSDETINVADLSPQLFQTARKRSCRCPHHHMSFSHRIEFNSFSIARSSIEHSKEWNQIEIECVGCRSIGSHLLVFVLLPSVPQRSSPFGKSIFSSPLPLSSLMDRERLPTSCFHCRLFIKGGSATLKANSVIRRAISENT